MDIALIIGTILGLIMIGLGIFLNLTGGGGGAGFGTFISPSSFLIVLGGMIASVFVAFPLRDVIGLGAAIGAVAKPADDKMGDMVDEACNVAELGRKGQTELQSRVDSINDYFFKDGINMVIDGYGIEEITKIMETRIRYREKREKVQADMLKSMGTLAPAWGMVGTLIGLVIMLAGFGGGGGADALGVGMSAALITTFYGAVFANLFFLPMSDKLVQKTKQTSMSSAMWVEATRLIKDKKHPIIVREILNSYIPPKEWRKG